MKTVMTAMLVVTLLAPAPVLGMQQTQAPGVSLHLAVFQGNVDVIRQHVAAGSDLNARDAYGSTPLIVATIFDRTEAAKALIEAGADLNLTSSSGGTALHAAAFFCRTEIVEALLEHGADRYLRDHAGNMAIDAVAAPFDDVKGIYHTFGQALAPLGLQLDYERISRTRPQIEKMLRAPAEDVAAVDYTPLPGGDWPVSTPAAQGLDPMLVGELYLDAAAMDTLYSVLIVKNGHLIAEGYFNEGSVDQKALLQSVTKSYTSALVGMALDRGCLSSVDQKMIDFFPELADRITDPRKQEITIRQLLQMRAGYPWEETDPELWDALLTGDYLHLVVDFPLIDDPGAEFHYSNLSSHFLAVIVARACDTDLRAFGQEHLFSSIGAEVGEWTQDADGYRIGGGEIHFTARDAAKFGLLYLNDGAYEGEQVVPAAWVEQSLERYSEGMYDNTLEDDSSNYLGPYLRDVGYGYQWWSARVGDHQFDYAWGHGGQLIVVLDEFDMVVVVTAYPFHLQHDDESWRHERANLNLVGKFIKSLPEG